MAEAASELPKELALDVARPLLHPAYPIHRLVALVSCFRVLFFLFSMGVFFLFLAQVSLPKSRWEEL